MVRGAGRGNVFIERLWRSVKSEEIYIREYNSVTGLVQSLKQCFNFYNFERPHQLLDGKMPANAAESTKGGRYLCQFILIS